MPHPERRADPRRLVTPLVGLGCALVLALAIWWVLAGSQSGADSASADRAVARTQPAAAARTPGATPAAAPAACACRYSRPAMPRRERSEHAGGSAGSRPQRRAPRSRPDDRRARPRAAARAHQRQLGRGLRFARRTTVLRRGERRQRAERRRAAAAARGARQRRRGVASRSTARRATFPRAAVDGEGARFVVNRSGSLSRARQ